MSLKRVPCEIGNTRYRYLTLKTHEAPRLNLGCGYNHLDGCINIDRNPAVEPDVECDFESEPLPFEDDSINYVCAVSVLEHIGPGLFFLLDQVYRVLRNGGTFEILVPACFHTAAIEDPTHVRFFGPESPAYWKASIYQGPKSNTDWYSEHRFNFSCKNTMFIMDPNAPAPMRGNNHATNVVWYFFYTLEAVKPLPEPTERVIRVWA